MRDLLDGLDGQVAPDGKADHLGGQTLGDRQGRGLDADIGGLLVQRRGVIPPGGDPFCGQRSDQLRRRQAKPSLVDEHREVLPAGARPGRHLLEGDAGNLAQQ